jgi:uncharacterized protein
MYYILLIAGMLLMTWAQFHVKGTYNKYASVGSSMGMTGAEVAQTILQQMGVNDVSVEPVAGQLSDHYDSASLSAAAIAAHECGHVLQDVEGYKPMNLRAGLVPVANFGSQFSPLLVMGGLSLLASGMALGDTLFNIGIVLFAASVLFHVVTLPVEFDASRRALKLINELGILQGDENKAARKVLGAAAFTYVASTLYSVLQLLQLWSMRRRES